MNREVVGDESGSVARVSPIVLMPLRELMATMGPLDDLPRKAKFLATFARRMNVGAALRDRPRGDFVLSTKIGRVLRTLRPGEAMPAGARQGGASGRVGERVHVSSVPTASRGTSS